MAPLEQKLRSSPRLRALKIMTPMGKHSPVKCNKLAFKTPMRGSDKKLYVAPPTKSSMPHKENNVSIPAANSPKKKRGPRPAHSGVPVPDKMRKLLEKLNKEEGLEIGPKTPLKSSTVLRTLTPRAEEKNLSVLKEKILPNNKNVLNLTTSLRREPKPAHSGVPIPDKMRKLIEENLL